MIGESYTRQELASTWGYAGPQAIGKGVFTPRKSPYIILFVTVEKQKSQTQYRDSLQGSTLYWEGETGCRSDNRIIEAEASGDTVLLFFRPRHHQPFLYLGPIVLERYTRSDDPYQPTSFVFRVASS